LFFTGSGTQFMIPVSALRQGGGGGVNPMLRARAGENPVSLPVAGGRSFMDSTEPADRERREEGNCANCGAVHGLKLCTGCRSVVHEVAMICFHAIVYSIVCYCMYFQPVGVMRAEAISLCTGRRCVSTRDFFLFFFLPLFIDTLLLQYYSLDRT
jgi:hypothetical protein